MYNFLSWFTRVESKLDALAKSVQTLLSENKHMAADLTTLQQQVQQTTDLEQSAVVLINGLADQLKAVATDPAKVQALADSLKASAASLAAAVTANTPAKP